MIKQDIKDVLTRMTRTIKKGLETHVKSIRVRIEVNQPFHSPLDNKVMMVSYIYATGVTPDGKSYQTSVMISEAGEVNESEITGRIINAFKNIRRHQ